MNYSRSLNNHINILHEKALCLVYKNFTSSFAKLLEEDNSVTIYQRDLQTLAIEMFKVKKNKNNLAPDMMNNVFRVIHLITSETTQIFNFQHRNKKMDLKLCPPQTLKYWILYY